MCARGSLSGAPKGHPAVAAGGASGPHRGRRWRYLGHRCGSGGSDLWRDDRPGDGDGQDDAAGSRRAGRDQASSAFLVQLLANGLVGRPASSSRDRQPQTDPSEAIGAGEIGHLQRCDVVAPQVPRQRHRWRHGPLGQMAVPLCPGARLSVDQVEGVHHRSALPAIVPGRLRPTRRVRPGRHVSPPPAPDGGRIDVECQARQAAPGDSSSLMSRATRRAWPPAINPMGVQSSRASIGFTIQTGM